MNRTINATTPAGPALRVVSVDGSEALSELFEYRVSFKSISPDIDCQKMIGAACAITLETQGGGQRYWHGQMVRFSFTGRAGKDWTYEAIVRPRLWHASRRSDCRIWQNKTVPDILKEVLDANGIAYDTRLKETYRPWEYLTQYRESDLNFISRLMEHEGIYYWFEHSAGNHVLVLGDHFSTHEPFPGYATVPWYPPDNAYPDKDHFQAWRLAREVETGTYIHTDYDFKKPPADLTTKVADPKGHLYDQYEIFDFPGGYTDPGAGRRYAEIRLQGLQAEQDRVHGQGRVRGATPGYRLTLEKHPRSDQNRELLIVRAQYHMSNNAYEGAGGSEQSHFEVSVEAMPAKTQFRPRRSTPKPHTLGPETAVVVGPSGEEIYTNEHGQVKVKFFWDRYGKKDGADSCWIRVSHPWAGMNYGGIHIPRINQEVIVDFLNGDPDYPIIIGRVYNADQMPPWGLPGNKTQSGTLTRWSNGGGGASMLRFEDKKGIEHLELSNTYGQTHLHMGYLMNQGTQADRGYGFELRTNLWGSIRADKGLLLTTYTQDYTTKSANHNPDGADHMNDVLGFSAGMMQNAGQAVSAAKDAIGAICSGKTSQIAASAATLAGMFSGNGALSQAGSCWQALAGGGGDGGSGGEAGVSSESDPAMADAMEMMNLSRDITKPIVSIVSPEGHSMTSPKPVVISSGQSVSIRGKSHMTLTTGAQFTQLVKKAMSTHVEEGGQVNVVSKGDVASTASDGAMNLVSKKDMSITSTEANSNVIAKKTVLINAQEQNIQATAKQGISLEAEHTIAETAGESIALVCGKSSIVLKKDGTIEIIGVDITINGTGKGKVSFDGDLDQFGAKINLNC
jgi:type VI secretion system secreted protein VgrG